MALRADRRQCQRPGLGNFDEAALPSDAGRGCALGGGLLEATSASAKKKERETQTAYIKTYVQYKYQMFPHFKFQVSAGWGGEATAALSNLAVLYDHLHP